MQLAGMAFSLAVAIGVMRANPERDINRSFAVFSLVGLAWQGCLVLIGLDPNNVVFWLRCASAFAATFPFFMWIMKMCAEGRSFSLATATRGWFWALMAAILIGLCFTHSFIPAESTPGRPLFGWAWPVYNSALVIQFVGLLVLTLISMRRLSGIQRAELQILLLGSTASGIGGILLVMLGPLLGLTDIRYKLPVMFMGFYGLTAWAVTSRRVLDARQLFRSGAGYGLELAVTAVLVGAGLYLYSDGISPYAAIVFVAVVITLAHRRLAPLRNQLIGVGGNDLVRRELMAISGDTREPEVMESRFLEVLSRWGKTERSYIFTQYGVDFASSTFPKALPHNVVSFLIWEGWLTLEKLSRLPQSDWVQTTKEFMLRWRLSAIVASPTKTDQFRLIVALGTRSNQALFTYADAVELEEWAFIVDGALNRVRLLQQAQESEQLATAGLLGASLAHEIRNPLVSIKSVVHAAKDRFNDPGFRRLLVDVVPGEIERIEGLVDGLMDLGRPRDSIKDQVSLHKLINSTMNLLSPKSKDNGVTLICNLTTNGDLVLADAAAIRQVILNLTMNAIDAVSSLSTPRQVTITTKRQGRLLTVDVADNGPGVTEEVQKTMFRPFTKSTKSNGMGLGLAISADIMRAHNGSIRLHYSSSQGACFRIALPAL